MGVLLFVKYIPLALPSDKRESRDKIIPCYKIS